MEEDVRKRYPDINAWLLHLAMEASLNEKLFERYKDIEPMIAELEPRGYTKDSAAYLMMVKVAIQQLVYAVIRHVDDVEENYNSLVYTFFTGILAKCWGEGSGWSKDENGGWAWSSKG